jgi:arsenate reductase-like glutaredoxin family protein
MPIQIFGTKKCKSTQKALRFFKERGVAVHHVDVSVKPLSAGELDNIARSTGWPALVDKGSKTYMEKRLDRYLAEPRALLLDHPAILATPVVRRAGRAAVGDDPAAWQAFAEAEKGS